MTLGSGVTLVNGGGVRLDAASTTVLGDAFSIPVKCARHVVGIYNVPRQCGEGVVRERFRWTDAPPDGKAIAWQAGAPATARGEVATP